VINLDHYGASSFSKLVPKAILASRAQGGTVLSLDSEKKISNLEKRIEQLEEKIQELADKVLTLSVIKITDSRFPYFNWLLTMSLSDDKRSLLEGIMSVLSDRLKGEEVPDIFKKEVPGVPMNILYSDHIPNYKETEEIITGALDISEKIIPNMLRAMYKQGKFKELCEYLLTEIGEEPWSECI